MIVIEDEYVGKIYGCYEIISRTNQRANDGHIIYNCRCIHCGIEKQMQLSSIKYKKSTECVHYVTIGNVTIPNVLEDNSIPDKRLRKIYLNILRRCYDTKDKSYRFYGAKGVTVCDEWLSNPSLFYQWTISNNYKNTLTIDRIDEHKDYSPDNCRWIPFKDNSRFKSTTNYITATVTLSGRQWADLIPEHGTNYINTMIREQGKEKAIEYIEKRFSDKHNLYNQ